MTAHSLIPAGISHPRVRQFMNVKRNRAPNQSGALALEGLWALRHAVDAGIDVEVVFACPSLLRGDEAQRMVDGLRHVGAACFEVSDRVLRRMVDRDGPDGLAAIAHMPKRTMGDLAVGAGSTVLIADSFELAGNLGTLIRCADGAGATGLVLTDRKIRLSHPLVLRASMGTVFTMPVVEADRESALGWARSHGVRMIGADPAATTSYRDADYRGPTAIVMGSERYGLAPFWRDECDQLVSIPMLGVADSLNVAHAAALLLYEALHQRPA